MAEEPQESLLPEPAHGLSRYQHRPAVVVLSESRVLGSATAREAGLPLLPLEERNFESGEFKLRPLESVRGRSVMVLQTLAGTPEAPVSYRLLRLLFLLQVLRDGGADCRIAVLPYFAFARKDRRTQPRDPISSRYVAELIEAAGASCVAGLDVHNQAAFENAFRIPALHLTALPLLAHHIASTLPAATGLVVVSPDPGGIKRAQLFREQLTAATGRDVDIAFIDKRRAGAVVSGGSLAGEVRGRTVLVVDDLCTSGGTLIRAAEACLRQGATQVHAVVTHMPLRDGIDALLAADNLAGVLATDSAGIAAPPDTKGKLVMLPAAPLLGAALQRLATDRPLSPLLKRWPVQPLD